MVCPVLYILLYPGEEVGDNKTCLEGFYPATGVKLSL